MPGALTGLTPVPYRKSVPRQENKSDWLLSIVRFYRVLAHGCFKGCASIVGLRLTWRTWVGLWAHVTPWTLDKGDSQQVQGLKIAEVFRKRISIEKYGSQKVRHPGLSYTLSTAASFSA